ncbi:MAG: hypothetical protein WC389_00425 [Lutibacter sp.]|jgi:hypothetical protein
MKNIKQKKQWRINLIISYCGENSAEINRSNIIEFLNNLSSIYKLDYTISINHPFKYDKESFNQLREIESDIYYFRSNKNSLIDPKELRMTINSLFSYKTYSYYEGVEFYTQLYRVLREYPFPKEFCRPLKYPFFEYHFDSKKEILIYSNEVMKVIEKQQDFPLN